MPGPPVTGPQSTGGQGVPLTSTHPVYPPPTHGLGNGRAGVPMPQMMPGPPPPVSGPQHAGGPHGGPQANVHYQTVQGPTNSRTGVPMSQVMTGPPVSGPQPGGGQGGPIPNVHYQAVQGPGNNRQGVQMVPQQSMRPHTPSSSSGNTMHQGMPVFPHFPPHSAPYFVNNPASVNFVPPASGGSNPMLTIPGAAVQSISYTHPQHGHVRMPFQSHHGQHPIYNYSAYHYPVMMTPGQPPQPVMPTSQNQQQGPPRGGQPMPSQSPANVSGTMMPPMSVEQQEARKAPQVPPPSQPPLKKREKKCALIQDPNTMEVVQLEKLAQSDAPTSKSSTGGSGTNLNVDTTTSGAPSVTPVATAPVSSSSTPKAETTTTESSDKNKNLNNTPDHHVQVEFIEKISKAASSDSKPQSDACKTTETSAAVSKTESSNRFENVMQDKKPPESKVPETQKDLAQKQELPVKDNSTTTMTATDDKVSAAVNKDSSFSSKNVPSPKVTTPSSSTSKILENNTSPKISSTKITSTVPAAQDSAQQKTLKQTTTSTDVPKTKLVVQAPADSTKVNGEVSEPLPSTPKTVEELKTRVADDKDSSDTTPSSPPSSTSMTSISTAADDTSVYLKGGRYVYTREELLRFEKAPASHVKPNIDKKIDDVIRAGKKVSLVGLDPFMPTFVARSGPGGRPSMRPSIGQYTGRSSQDMRQQPRKIIPTPSLSQDVKLHTTENAWKPEVGGQKKALSVEETEHLKTKELEKKFRGYLNKITPQKYDVIQDKIQELKIDTEDRLTRVLNLVFDKAVDEPSFCLQYANLCKYLSSLSLTKLEDGKETKVEFWRLLIMRCQQEFEKDIYEGIDVEGKLAAINEEQEAEKKKILNAELDDEKHRARKRSLGIMKLIGELYRLNMLKGFIMVNCINRLIADPTEDENLECLCMFLRTVGQKLEGELAMRKEEHMKKFNEHFLTLQTIVNEKKVSSRVRFLIQDIIDMRNNNWQERSIHKDNKPKTIDQIHEEAARQEERNQQEHLQHLAMRNERRRREGESAPQARRSQQGQTQQELSKIQQILDGMRNLQSSGQVDSSNISLGGAQNLSKWSSGSKTQSQAAVLSTGRPDAQLGPQGGRYGGGSSISQSSRATPGYGDMAKSRSQGPPTGSSRVTSLHIQSHGPPKSSTPPFGPRNEIGGPDRSRHASLDKQGGGRGSMPSSRSGSQRVDSPAHSQSRERPRKAEQEEELTEGKAENRVKWVLDEGLQNNAAHVVGLVRDYFDEKTIHWFLQFGFNQTLEASPDKRHLFGDVCAQLLKQADVNFEVFLNEFKELMSMSVDLVVDIPLFWIYLGEIIARIIPELSIEERKTIFSVTLSQDRKTKGADEFIASTLQTIARRSNEGLAYDIWHNSNITWNEFLSVNVEEFAKERQLEFLLSSSGPPLPVNSSDFTATLERLLRGSDPVRSLSEFVKDKVSDKSSETISALTTAIIRGSLNLDTREDNGDKLLKKELFGELCRTVLSKVVAFNETLEFEVLYSMQELMEDLKHPQQLSGLLLNELVEGDVVSAETVFKWVDSPSKERIKGLAMTVAQAKRVIDYLREECEGGEEAKNEN